MNELLKSILDGIYGFIGSYGLSVVLFTLLIKCCLLPLDYKSRKGMRKMSALAPKQAELQKKYGHDQDKLNRKMQELYKKEGASPLSGCWPMLLSMPILFAMYAALRYMANEQLVQQTFDFLLNGDIVFEPFLWVKNLWMPDSPFNASLPNLQSLQMVEEKQWLAIFNALNAEQVSALAAAINVPELTTASFVKGDALNATIKAIGDSLAALPAYVEQTAAIPYMSIDLLVPSALMTTDVLVCIRHLHILDFPVANQVVEAVGYGFQGLFLFCQSKCLEQAVCIDDGWKFSCTHLDRISLGNGIFSVSGTLGIIECGSPHTVGLDGQ